VYPAELRGSGKEDVVFVVFIVNQAGEVTRARVACAQYPDCEKAALEAIEQWKFTPGRHEGRIVNTRMWVRFGFKEKKP
jgi:TonB family protein